MTHLSLFAGVGGIDLAAHWAGFRTIQFVEREPFCQRVLAKNFLGIPIHDDVTTFDATKHRGVDLVSAGFPCQPHSLAGKRLASGDERDLWSEVVRTLGEAQPRWFLGENVSGLLTSESGRLFGRVVSDLVRLGYRVGWGSFRASFAGAVHPRKRVFIVAYNIGDRVERLPARSVQRFPALQRVQDVGRFEEFARRPMLFDARLCRGRNGVPFYVDRLRALGNAVCPYQVYPILEAIAKEC